MFPFQVYPRFRLPTPLERLRAALFDPHADSRDVLENLGIRPTLYGGTAAFWTALQSKDADFLILGRNALDALADDEDWWRKLPPTMPILVLEQSAASLENIGFRAFPARPRQAFIAAPRHPILRGIAEPDLRDWRVDPALLSRGVAPLRNGYNWHTGYCGAVASVEIETPMVGNFAPILQCGFDMASSPLVEADWLGRRWAFCQLSLPEGVGRDPVATRIMANLLAYLNVPVEKRRTLHILGTEPDLALARQLGAEVEGAATADALPPDAIVLVGTGGAGVEALREWVRGGGTAVVLPQQPKWYGARIPQVPVKAIRVSLVPINGVRTSPIARGPGQNDLHYRQPLDALAFGVGESVIHALTDGEGRGVFVGFDPRKLDLEEQPYLRLTYRRQMRTLAQVLTNVGADLGAATGPVCQRAFKPPPAPVSGSRIGRASIREKSEALGQAWTAPEIDGAGDRRRRLARVRSGRTEHRAGPLLSPRGLHRPRGVPLRGPRGRRGHARRL